MRGLVLLRRQIFESFFQWLWLRKGCTRKSHKKSQRNSNRKESLWAQLPCQSIPEVSFNFKVFTTFLRVICCQVVNISQDRYSKISLSRINENFESVNANADKLVNTNEVRRERKWKQNKTVWERKLLAFRLDSVSVSFESIDHSQTQKICFLWMNFWLITHLVLDLDRSLLSSNFVNPFIYIIPEGLRLEKVSGHDLVQSLWSGMETCRHG